MSKVIGIASPRLNAFPPCMQERVPEEAMGTHKVVSAAAIKGMAEEVEQDGLSAALNRAVHAVHIGCQLGILAVLGQRVQDQHHWIQYPWHLRGYVTSSSTRPTCSPPPGNTEAQWPEMKQNSHAPRRAVTPFRLSGGGVS